MSVLVTGAGGFLGRRLVERLCTQVPKVLAVSRAPVPEMLSTNAHVEWLRKDLVTEGLSARELADVQIVFHLAGAKELGTGEDERLFLEVNEALTLNLLHLSRRPPRKFIYSSSQMVYGDPGNTAVTEEFPLMGMDSSAYACSKVNAENWLRCLQKTHGGLCICLRFCGFVETGGNIDYMIDRALRNEPLELLSKGLVFRDYLPVGSGVEALLAACRYEAGVGFEAFNIGSGQAVSVREMAGIICDELGSRSEIVLSERPAPRRDFVFNIGKAARNLGFEPGDLRAAVRAHARRKLESFRSGPADG